MENNRNLSPTLAITGSAGFLGGYLVKECLLQGSFNLRLLLRNPDQFKLPLNDGVAICQGDLLASESLQGFLAPDSTLIHLVYLNEGITSNIKATLNLIEAVKYSGVKRVVHCSTAVVVGFQARGTISETTPPAPIGEYQRAKLEIEKILQAGLPPKIELAILRPTEIIGPGGQGLSKMIKRIQYGKPCKKFIYNAILRSRRFNYVSVHNVVAALILLASTPVEQLGEVYYISDDDDADNNYAAVEKIINSSLGHQSKYFFNIRLPRSFLSFIFNLLPAHSPPNRIYTHSKIDALGYKKVISLRLAISEILSLEKNNAHS